jgi:hypothetical protein
MEEMIERLISDAHDLCLSDLKSSMCIAKCLERAFDNTNGETGIKLRAMSNKAWRISNDVRALELSIAAMHHELRLTRKAREQHGH